MTVIHVSDTDIAGKIAAGLQARDWVIHHGFIDSARCARLRTEAEALRAAGHFRAAGIGQAAERHSDIRSDELLWIEPGLAPEADAVLQQEFEMLRQALNTAAFLGLHEFEGHYAVYPRGAAYARHLDRFREDNRRVISVVLYLNDAWESADGGELKLYPDGSDVVTVLPEAGTLVCFLSESMPHEVLPSRCPRLSLTGWFRRRG